ncbi:MAG: hypothetical protein R6U15_00980 [Candidatus Izemoplasmatales bacterium]
MKRIEKALDIQYKALHENHWDNVLLITGDEGTGKSNLALHLLEYWLNKKYGEVDPEKHNNYINLDIELWANSLSQCNNGDMNILDESGEMSNKRSMSKLNFAIEKTYQIIRGNNINSIFVLPSVFDMSGFFTKRRARGLIYVYKRGRFAYWNKEKLRDIIDINSRKILKKVWVRSPTFNDHFPIYKGKLLDIYNQKKKDHMKDTRAELAKTIADIKKNKEPFSERDKIIYRLRKKYEVGEVAKITKMTKRNIQMICKKIKENNVEI